MQSDHRAPHEYPRRVLLAVAGTTPQILTETLYALSQQEHPFIPTEVHVVTTSEGIHELLLKLLHPKSGKFHEFCRDFNLIGNISFLPENIKVLTDSNGQFLTDIISPRDNERVADQIVEWLRDFTHDEDCAIHACLAGGRKTMGFYLGYGLSLYARKQDRLSHVMVSSEFEGNREFFYKPPTPKTLNVSRMVNGAMVKLPMSTEDAKIWLAEIPFVRLREGLPIELLSGKTSFTAAVQTVQSNLPDSNLVINFELHRIIFGGIEIKMQPRLFAFYTWLIKRRIEFKDMAAISWKDTLGEDNALLRQYFDIYLTCLKGDVLHPDYLEAKRAFGEGFEKDAWAQLVYHTNGCIRKRLGSHLGKQFEITSRRISTASRLSTYSIEIPIERITLTGT